MANRDVCFVIVLSSALVVWLSIAIAVPAISATMFGNDDIVDIVTASKNDSKKFNSQF